MVTNWSNGDVNRSDIPGEYGLRAFNIGMRKGLFWCFHYFKISLIFSRIVYEIIRQRSNKFSKASVYPYIKLLFPIVRSNNIIEDNARKYSMDASCTNVKQRVSKTIQCWFKEASKRKLKAFKHTNMKGPVNVFLPLWRLSWNEYSLQLAFIDKGALHSSILTGCWNIQKTIQKHPFFEVTHN